MSNQRADVLLLAYHFDPGRAIGAVRPFRFMKYLRQYGYRCTAIGAFVAEHPDPDVIHVPDKVGELWEQSPSPVDGPRRLSAAAHVERAVRKILTGGHQGIAWSRVVANVSCDLLAGRRMVLVSTYPPLGSHLAALQVAISHGVPWIADFRDPLANEPNLTSAPRRIRYTLSAIERLVFRRADAIIANTEAAAAHWRVLYPWAKSKLHVIWNGFDPMDRPKARPLPERSHRILVHAGSLYGGRNANSVIESCARLRAHSAAAKALRILLIGPIDSSSGSNADLCQRAAADGWLQIIPQPIPKNEALTWTESANGLLLLQPQSSIQVPGKLFEYLCIGRPILAVAPRNSAIEWILARANVPYVCIYPDDAADEVDAKMASFLNLPDTPVEASGWFYSHFDASRQARQMADIIDLTARPSD